MQGRGLLTDRSGTITLGGTAQVAIPANANRQYLFIENTSDTDLWFNFTTTAVVGQPSLKLTPNGSYTAEAGFVPTDAISVIGATTGKAFTAKEC